MSLQASCAYVDLYAHIVQLVNTYAGFDRGITSGHRVISYEKNKKNKWNKIFSFEVPFFEKISFHSNSICGKTSFPMRHVTLVLIVNNAVRTIMCYLSSNQLLFSYRSDEVYK